LPFVKRSQGPGFRDIDLRVGRLWIDIVKLQIMISRPTLSANFNNSILSECEPLFIGWSSLVLIHLPCLGLAKHLPIILRAGNSDCALLVSLPKISFCIRDTTSYINLSEGNMWFASYSNHLSVPLWIFYSCLVRIVGFAQRS